MVRLCRTDLSNSVVGPTRDMDNQNHTAIGRHGAQLAQGLRDLGPNWRQTTHLKYFPTESYPPPSQPRRNQNAPVFSECSKTCIFIEIVGGRDRDRTGDLIVANEKTPTFILCTPRVSLFISYSFLINLGLFSRRILCAVVYSLVVFVHIVLRWS